MAMSITEIRTKLNTPAWHSIPFMYKEDLRFRNYDDDVSSFGALHWFSSSGTTTSPVLYPWTVDDERIAERTLQKIHPPDDKMLGKTSFVIAPTGLPGMWYHMNKQLRHLEMATVFPGVDSPLAIISLIEQLKPKLLISLPLVLSRLGELFNKFSDGQPSALDFVFTGGDVLSNARRAAIEKLWNAKLRNFYGLSEVFGPLASETGPSHTLTWQADEVFVEILDPATKKPVQEGEVGVAVMTTLWDRPVSLVRYWTGDYFRLVDWADFGQPCFEVCGREQISLPGLKSGFFPRDVDDVLLADPVVGTEWKFEFQQQRVIIIIETELDESAVEKSTIEQLQAIFDYPISVIVEPLGTLDRSTPKLGVPIPV